MLWSSSLVRYIRWLGCYQIHVWFLLSCTAASVLACHHPLWCAFLPPPAELGFETEILTNSIQSILIIVLVASFISSVFNLLLVDARGQSRCESKRCLRFSLHSIQFWIFLVLVASSTLSSFFCRQRGLWAEDGAGAVGRGLWAEDGECSWPEAKVQSTRCGESIGVKSPRGASFPSAARC